MPGIGKRPAKPSPPLSRPGGAQPTQPPVEVDLVGLTAGEALLRRFDAALAAASREQGAALAWSEHERQRLSAAVELADRAERLDRMIAEELAKGDDAKPTTVVKLSAESRLLKRAVADHLSFVKIGAGQAKSERHVRAVNARWDRRNG